MVDPDHRKISISRQCDLLGMSRSSWYYRPKGESELNLNLMRIIDEQYMQIPFYGRPKMTVWLRHQGYKVNHKRVERLMSLMGLYAAQPRVNTSRKHPEHKVYPYLLRGVKINRPNQVWSTDITYIRLPVALFTWWLFWTGTVVLYWPGGFPIPWTPTSAWKLWKRLFLLISQRSSIPIRVLSLPVCSSLAYWRLTIFVSAWTVAAGSLTISWWNASGGR